MISSTPRLGSPQADPCRTALATASLVASMRSQVVVAVEPVLGGGVAHDRASERRALGRRG